MSSEANGDVVKECAARLKILRTAEASAGTQEILHTLDRLNKVEINPRILRKTEVGKLINSRHLLQHSDVTVRQKTSALVANWREIVQKCAREIPSNNRQQHMQAPSRASASGSAYDAAPPAKRPRVSMAPDVHVPGRAGAPGGAAPIPHQSQPVLNRSAPTGPSSGPVPRNNPAMNSANQYTPEGVTLGRDGPPTAGAGDSRGGLRASSSSGAGSTNTPRHTAQAVAGRSGSAAAAAAVSSTATSQRSYVTENFKCDFFAAASERASAMAAEGSRPSEVRGCHDPEPAAVKAVASASERTVSAAPVSGRGSSSTGSSSTKKEPSKGKSMRVNLVSLFTSSIPSEGGSSGKRGRKHGYFCFDFSNSGDCSRGESCPYPHVG